MIASSIPGRTVRPSSSGFTLLELLLVMAIMSILTAVAIPAFLPSSNQQVHGAAKRLAAGLRQVRNRAITRRTAGVFTVDIETRRFWMDGSDARHRLPERVKMDLFTAKSELESETRGGIRFFPDGSATGGRITLEVETARYAVDVDWFTGRIRILDADQVANAPPVPGFKS